MYHVNHVKGVFYDFQTATTGVLEERQRIGERGGNDIYDAIGASRQPASYFLTWNIEVA
jgi:hypothetical protein